MGLLLLFSYIVRTGSSVEVNEVGKFNQSLQKLEPRGPRLARTRKAMLLALQGVCRFSISASGTGLAATVAKVQAEIGAKRMLKN